MAALMCRPSNIFKTIRFAQLGHLRNTQSVTVQDQYDEDAHYPPIKPKFPPGSWGEMEPLFAWFWENDREKISALRNVKDKVDYITKGDHKVWKYNSLDTTPDMLEYQRKITKTYMIRGSLPALYDDLSFDDHFDDSLLKKIISESIIQELELNRERFKKHAILRDHNRPHRLVHRYDYEHSNVLSLNWFSNLLGVLSARRKDIFDSHVDTDVKISACWSRHGVLRKMPRRKPRIAKGKEYLRQNNSEFYGEHTVDFQLRKSKPLPEFVPTNDEICHNLKYSSMEDYNPRVLGQFRGLVDRKFRPGYNIGSTNEFNHLSFISLKNPKLKRIEITCGESYGRQANYGYAMSTGFLSTVAQAHMLGFNMHEELTYPFTTQTILTDGQNFILSAYQLNTLQLWKDDKANTLQNVCWATESEKLYEEYKDGELVGFNDNLLKQILKMFLIQPCDRNGIDLAPNLTDHKPSPLDIPGKIIYRTVEEDFKYDKGS
ncbi:large ribosomal subunit protein mL65-like [Ruditapes philippinarum]|uniref:large ribosomal subunit protein mL65-like n=1 Tax=Ruditapes philippinarum TaxID=129788 RepID=UPI00295BF776|nr:large ribosomal subunit protein mL65-like [Ruditapes philippinarum]